MWEEAIRSPFIMRGGSSLGSGQQVFTELTEFIDLTPSVLDMLKIPALESVQGKSLLPLITGESDSHKDIVFSEFLVDNKAMVRSDTWKYIFTSGKRDLGQGYETGNPPPGITHRLYNLEKDPQEHQDVSSAPENQEILIAMQDAMLTIFKETHPDADKLPGGLTREDQLVWFCIPVEDNPNLEAR
jgi:arylsulfatase A-like enzyme